MRFTAVITCITSALLAGACLFCAAPSFAEGKALRVETVSTRCPDESSALALLVNGLPALELSYVSDDGRQALESKLARVTERLVAAFRQGDAEFAVGEGQLAGNWDVMLNGVGLISATEADASRWGDSSARHLAERWRESLEKAFQTEGPADAMATEAAQAVQGGSQHLASPSEHETGEQLPKSPIRLDPVLAPLKRTQPTQKQRLPNPTEFKTGLWYAPEGATLAPLLPPAQELVARVTGSPSSHASALVAISASLRDWLGIEPLDQLNWEIAPPEQPEEEKKRGRKAQAEPEPLDLSLPAGMRKRLSVNYAYSGTEGQAEVILENLTLTPPEESLSMFSNVPEGVKNPQLLYKAVLPPRYSARLTFHHQNQGGHKLMFLARCVNSEEAPVVVHVLPGTCKPSANTYWVGFASAEDFLAHQASNDGYILTVPPGGSCVLIRQGLQAGETSSGYYKITSLSQSPLIVETIVVGPDMALPNGEWTGEPPGSCGVFSAPYIRESIQHVLGQDWTYLRIGDMVPECQVQSGQLLYGCYGMTHEFKVQLTNPSMHSRQTAYVVLRGSAGEVKGQLSINGKVYTTALVKPGEEILIDTYDLGPGQSQMLDIKAIALNGGFYPASIILRATKDP